MSELKNLLHILEKGPSTGDDETARKESIGKDLSSHVQERAKKQEAIGKIKFVKTGHDTIEVQHGGEHVEKLLHICMIYPRKVLNFLNLFQ